VVAPNLCSFPYVYRGSLYYNCTRKVNSTETSLGCYAANRTWKICGQPNSRSKSTACNNGISVLVLRGSLSIRLLRAFCVQLYQSKNTMAYIWRSPDIHPWHFPVHPPGTSLDNSQDNSFDQLSSAWTVQINAWDNSTVINPTSIILSKECLRSIQFLLFYANYLLRVQFLFKKRNSFDSPTSIWTKVNTSAAIEFCFFGWIVLYKKEIRSG